MDVPEKKEPGKLSSRGEEVGMTGKKRRL